MLKMLATKEHSEHTYKCPSPSRPVMGSGPDAVLVCMSERDKRRTWSERTNGPPGTTGSAGPEGSVWADGTERRLWFTRITRTRRKTCVCLLFTGLSCTF